MFRISSGLVGILMLMLSTGYCDELHVQGIDNSVVQETEHEQTDAQTSSGSTHKEGEDVTNDSEEILKWYLERAEQGEATAQYFLALLYRIGDGTPVNYEEAMKWLLKSAEQGYSSAQVLLGYMYKNGEGVPVNYVKAYAWMSLPTSQRHEDAKRMIKILTKMMTHEQIAEAEKEAAELQEWLQK